MIPKCKIQTYTGAVLDYTITDDASNVHVRDLLNGVGTFHFVLPTVKGTVNQGYGYTDIALNDKVKIYFWYADEGDCPATPNFIGKLCKISAPFTIDSGYARVFEGKLLTEILTRRLKRDKSWVATDADEIVIELANDLGLGVGDIAVDTTDVTLCVDVESYFDVLKKLSDYWYSAGTQIKKDFYVDVDNDLVWKARPLRSGASVESLQVGVNIDNYDVLRDVEPVRNYIIVYGYQGKIGVPGQEGRCEPSDKDSWTEATLDNWTLDVGDELVLAAGGKVGSNYVRGTSTAINPKSIKFRRSILPVNYNFGKQAYQTLNFYIYNMGDKNPEVWLYAPDSSNYFKKLIPGCTGTSVFQWKQYQLGENQEYDVDKNPTGWIKVGSPKWNNLMHVVFYVEPSDTTIQYYVGVDGLYFGHGRFRYTASNATSITNYGQRDMQIVDEILMSDAECATRAETLLYQLKDAPTRIDIETTGNLNILIGDQLSMTIPAEGISAAPYDVLAVEQDFQKQPIGLRTKASMVNSSNIRQLPSGTPLETMLKKAEFQREIGKGLQIVR